MLTPLSLWHFSVIAVMAVIALLVGTLVVYARVLANRVGKAYAALRRIEEGLISASAPGSYASGLVPSMAAAESAGVTATDVPVLERDRRVSYLTVRDLKVVARSGRRRSDTEVSQEAAAQLGARLFSGAQSDAASGHLRRRASQPAASQPGADEAGVDQAGASEAGAGAWASQAGAVHADADQVDAGPEPTGLSDSSAVLQELATATSEVRALLNESAEPAREFASSEPIEAASEPAPVHELASPPSSVEDQPAPKISRHTTKITNATAQTNSDTAQVGSDAAQVGSGTAQVGSDAAQVGSDIAQISSGTAQISSGTAQISSGTAQISSDTAQISSGTAQISSDTAQIGGGTAQISSDTDAELAEKRRKRNAELILAAQHRRRRARGH